MGYVRVFLLRWGTMKVIGIDVSAHRVDVVLLDKFPEIALRDFYLSPEFKQVHAVYGTNEIQDLVDRIGEIGESAVVAILEGTGTYSYFWKEQLQKKGIFVLVADQGMVKSTRRSLGGTDNKDDEFDVSSDVPIVSSSLSRNLRSPVLGQGTQSQDSRDSPYIT